MPDDEMIPALETKIIAYMALLAQHAGYEYTEQFTKHLVGVFEEIAQDMKKAVNDR